MNTHSVNSQSITLFLLQLLAKIGLLFHICWPLRCSQHCLGHDDAIRGCFGSIWSADGYIGTRRQTRFVAPGSR